MKQKRDDYEVVPYSKLRQVLEVMYPSVQREVMTHGWIGVDVSGVREFVGGHKAKTGEALSFTAFIIACLGKAVDENKSLHACRKGRKHLILFDEVDVAIPIEREMAGQKQPIIYIIRAANKKTFREIHHEIRAAQVEQVEKAWEGFTAIDWLRFLPIVFIRIGSGAFCCIRRWYSKLHKKYGGAVGITAVGKFGKGGGWGITLQEHTV